MVFASRGGGDEEEAAGTRDGGHLGTGELKWWVCCVLCAEGVRALLPSRTIVRRYDVSLHSSSKDPLASQGKGEEAIERVSTPTCAEESWDARQCFVQARLGQENSMRTRKRGA